MKIAPCSNCDGKNLYRSIKPVSSGGGYAPNYLVGLGGFLKGAKLDVVVCRDCGSTRFFAKREACEKLDESAKWERVRVS